MKLILSSLLASLSVLQATYRETPQESGLLVGYVIKFGGTGSVTLRRGNNNKLVIRSKADLGKRIAIYSQDEFESSVGSAFVYYYENSRPRRFPKANGKFEKGRKGATTLYGARPQSGDGPKQGEVVGWLFGEAGSRSIYVAPKGVFQVLWSAKRNVEPLKFRSESEGRVFEETLSASDRIANSPICCHPSQKLCTWLAARMKDDDATSVKFEIQFKGAAPLRGDFRLISKSRCATIDYAYSEWQEAANAGGDSFTEFDAFVAALDEAGCGMNAAAHLANWWKEEPTSYATRSAMNSLAFRSKCGIAELFFRMNE